jgi:hypothetical protein
MRISDKILKQWASLRTVEDAGKISKKLGVSAELIRRALRGGEASYRVTKAIAAYYRAKKKRIKKLLSG